MAKDSSFDVVSEIAMQEVDNAVNQTRHEAATRYDLKSSGCTVDFDKAKEKIELVAANDLALKSLADIVQSKFVRRGIDIKALRLSKPEAAPGGNSRQTAELIHGIPHEIGKEINKLLKKDKLKVSVQIRADQVRVTGKSKDNLQEAMRLIKSKDFSIPLQFTNFR